MQASLQVEVPQELAVRLRPFNKQLPRIIELGLREWTASGQPGFEGASEVLEFLARLPSPEDILTLQPSEALQNRVNSLLEKNQVSRLTAEEERDWERYQYLEHLVRMAKTQALLRLKQV
jgi:hypothetical protein